MQRFSTFLLCIVGCLLLPSDVCGQPSRREQQARETVQKYFEAYQQKDLDALMGMWHPDALRHAEQMKLAKQIFAETETIRVERMAILRAWTRGTSARIVLSGELGGKDTKTGKTHKKLGKFQRVMELRRESRAWKVWKFQEHETYHLELYRSVPTKQERVELLEQDRALAPELSRILSRSAWDASDRGEHDEALRLSDASLEVTQFVGAVEDRAWYDLCRGFVLRNRKNHKEALECLLRAREGFRREQQDVGEALTLCQLGRVYVALDQQSKAFEAFETAGGMGRLLRFMSESWEQLHPVGQYHVHFLDLQQLMGDQLVQAQDFGAPDYGAVLADNVLDLERTWLGDSCPAVAYSYVWKASFLAQAGKLDEAIGTIDQAIAIGKRLFGNNHDRLVDWQSRRRRLEKLQSLSVDQRQEYWDADREKREALQKRKEGKFEEAEKLLSHALSVFGKLMGRESSVYAFTLSERAYLLRFQKKYAEAVDCYEDADRTFRKVYGKDHEYVVRNAQRLARTLNVLGEHQYQSGEYTKALTTIEKYREWITTRLGRPMPPTYRWEQLHIERLAGLSTTHQQTARAALAVVRTNRSKKEASAFRDEAKLTASLVKLKETASKLRTLFGEDDYAYYECQHRVALLLLILKRHEELRHIRFQQLAILKRCGLEKSPTHATLLLGMGQVALARGDLASAGRYINEANKLYEAVYDADHNSRLIALESLAKWHSLMGNGKRSFELYFQVAQTYKKKLQGGYVADLVDFLEVASRDDNLEKTHLEYAKILALLASRYRVAKDIPSIEFGKNEAARALLQRMNLVRKVQGEQDPAYVTALLDIVSFTYQLGRSDLARPYLYQARDIVTQGEPSRYRWRLPELLRWLGVLYHDEGDHLKASDAFRRRLALLEAFPGPDSKEYRAAMLYLIVELKALGKTEDTQKYTKRLLHLDETALANAFQFASEQQMDSFLNTQTFLDLETLFNWMTIDNTIDSDTIELFWTWVLRRKGVLLDALCRSRDAQRTLATDPTLAAQVVRLRHLREQLTQLVVYPPKGVSAQQLQRDKEELQKEIERVQQGSKEWMIRNHPEVLQASTKPSLTDVHRQLTPGSALIELIRFQPVDCKAVRSRMKAPKPRYLALVLVADRPCKPQLFDLGEAESIEGLTADLRDKIAEFPRAVGVSSEASLEREFREIAARLYAKLIEPLKAALGKSTTLLLVPDGGLHQLPFAALVDAEGKYLVESYRCAYLSSARDLLQPKASTPGKGVVVYGDPDYDLKVQQRIEQASKLPRPIQPAPKLVLRGPVLPTRGGASWTRLEATGTEAVKIKELLSKAGWNDIHVYSREHALEERIKQVYSPQILHLGTHGEFVNKHSPEDNERVGRELGTEARLARMKNPLLRSYLVMAGGNHPETSRPGQPRVDDGLLTAEEVAMLHLQGTELVVLSACKSGLGDVRGSEGVYGLRRAFVYAGARTLVLTLFSVPSEASMNLMTSFYTHLAKGKSRLDALHLAQIERIQARRKSGGAAHPIFWVGYTLIGETGPLTNPKAPHQ